MKTTKKFLILALAMFALLAPAIASAQLTITTSITGCMDCAYPDGTTFNNPVTFAGGQTLSSDTKLANGKALEGSATSGETFKISAFDNNTPAGGAYVPYLTFTNGNTPSLSIAPSAGGSTLAIDGATIGGVTPGTAVFSTAQATTANVGVSGTAGTLNVFPATAANGKFVLQSVNNTGNFASTLKNSNIGQATVYSLADPGAATANILNDAGAQTILGAKTFTNSTLLELGSSTGATTITSDNAGASNFTMHLPAANDTLAAIAAAQTLTNKTLTDFIDSGSVVSSAISATSGSTGTTLTNIPGLTVAVTAAKTYAFHAYVTGTSTTNGGVKFAFANSGSTTSASYTCIQNNGTTQNAHSTTTTMGNAVGAATTVLTDAECWGVVVVNAGGNLTMQFAQNASHADTTTINANGYMSVRRLN